MSGIQSKYVRKVLRTQSGIALIWLHSYHLSFPWPLEMSHKTRCWNLTQRHPFKKRLCHQSSATVYVSRCGFFFFGWWFNLPSSSVATLLPLARGILSLVIKLGWARHWKNHKLNSALQKACDTNVTLTWANVGEGSQSSWLIIILKISGRCFTSRPKGLNWRKVFDFPEIHPTNCPNLTFKTMQANVNIQ